VQSAIYVLQNGVLTKVFDDTDSLDGRELHRVELEGFSGDTLVFIAHWGPLFDSSLYRATLPASQ